MFNRFRQRINPKSQAFASDVFAASPLYKNGVANSGQDTALQGTVEFTLLSLLIPANTIQRLDGLQFMNLWSCTNSAETKRIRGRFGGTVLWNLDLTIHRTFRQDVIMLNRDSQSSQIVQANSTTIFAPIGSVGVQETTIDFSVDQVFTITGQFPVAGTGLNTLTLEAAIIRKL